MADRDAIRLEYAYALQDLGGQLEEVTGDGAKAKNILTLTANVADTNTVTIDGKPYTFKAVLTDVDGHVLRGASGEDSLDNLIAAITLDAGAGTLYAASTVLHPTVTASWGPGVTMIVTAKLGGVDGNLIACAETVTGSWLTPTLTGGSGLEDDVRERAIDQAIREYSRRFFNIKTSLVSSVATGYYSVPSEWVPGLSRIVSIEYPVDNSPPIYLAPKSWRIVRRESDQVVYIVPNPGGNFRLTFTTKHDEVDPDTIPIEHEGALGKWAAKIAAQSFMAKYANSVAPNSDAVNYRTKEQEWRHVYDTLREQLDRELGPHEVRLQNDSDPFTYYRNWNI